MMNRLLLAGSNTIHTYNYYQLIGDQFDKIHVITDKQTDLFESVSHDYVDFSVRKFHKITSTIKFIKKTILEFKPDVIHIQQAGTEAWLVLKATSGLNIPVIVTAWGSDILLTPSRGRIFRNMIDYILNNADYFTCDSAYVAARMQELSGKNNLNLCVANFGIDTVRKDVQKENIIYSNRLHKKLYRIDHILHAFKRFIEKRNDESWQLIIAGEGEETENLKSLAKELGIDKNTEFPGWVNKEVNSEYYNKARIFVSIPASDATSISLLEAMASDCIPVLSNLPANHEWVIDGLNGIIAVSFTEDFLEKALELDAERLKEINSSIIANKGTRKANKEIFVSLYKEILGA